MNSRQQKKDSPAGGIALLAAVGWLCLKELKRIDTRLKDKSDARRKKA